MLPYLNFTQLFVVLTFGYFLIYFNSKKPHQQIVLALLALSFTVELLNLILLLLKKEILIGIVYSVTALLFNSLWLLLLYSIAKRKYIKMLLNYYMFFALLNLFFGEGLKYFNHFTFIIGALLYLGIFIKESFSHLQNENLTLFLSNGYLLLVCPVIFMLGYSILISFNSRIINSAIVFNGISLYNVIGYFINSIYYTSLLVYCYREKKL